MMKNHHIARVIGDAGWHSFIMKLKYKAAAAGVHLVKLDQWFASSKTCHCCGHKVPEMPLRKRIWQCPFCRVEHDCDINAAINIQSKGTTELQVAGLVVSVHGGQRQSVISMVAAEKWEDLPFTAGSGHLCDCDIRHLLHSQRNCSANKSTAMIIITAPDTRLTICAACGRVFRIAREPYPTIR